MRTSGIRPGDLVVTRNRRDELNLSLVESRGPNGITALPLSEGRAATVVTSYQIVGHYRRKAGHLHEVRLLVSRIRQRFGVARDTARDEQHREWPDMPADAVEYDSQLATA